MRAQATNQPPFCVESRHDSIWPFQESMENAKIRWTILKICLNKWCMSNMNKCSGNCRRSQWVKITNIGYSIYIYIYIYEIAYTLPVIYSLLVALDAHMFSHNGYRPRTNAQGPRSCGPGPGTRPSSSLGLGPWSRAHIHHGWTYVLQGQSIGNQ